MATTSIWPVKGYLGKVVVYVEDPDKTANPEMFIKPDMTENERQGLSDVIEYAAGSEKTAMKHFVSGVNCLPETARDEMLMTKRLYEKEGGRVAFHGYQSFADGEVTPETAHGIGVKLAQEVWGDDFQVLVATHADNMHQIHSHFVVNSVAVSDGHRFHNSRQDYLAMRGASDRLCREYGLSVIEKPQCKGKHYTEWQAEKDGKQTWRSIVKADVDRAISGSMTDREFFAGLKSRGYGIKQGKDISVRPPGKERYVRLARNFGDSYTIENIRKRILANDAPALPPPKALPRLPGRTIQVSRPRRKISGLYGLYLHYQYLLGHLPRGSPRRNARMHFLLKEDIAKLDKIIDETRLLAENHIETAEQLFSYRENVTSKADRLITGRDGLRKMLRRKSSAGSEKKIKSDIAAVTAELRQLRRDVKMVDRIAERSGVIKEKMNTLPAQEIQKDKEEREYGQFR